MKKGFLIILTLIVILLAVGVYTFQKSQQNTIGSEETDTFTQGESEEKDEVREIMSIFEAEKDSYQKVSIDPIGESSEGSVGEYFLDENEHIIAIHASYFGETGKRIQRFYFQDQMLRVVEDAFHFYNRPVIYTEELAEELGDTEAFSPDKTRIELNKYYLENGNLKTTFLERREAEQTQEELFGEVNRLKDIFASHTNPSEDTIVFSCQTSKGKILLQEAQGSDFLFSFGSLFSDQELLWQDLAYYEYFRFPASENEGLGLFDLLFEVDNQGILLYSHEYYGDDTQEAGLKIYSISDQSLSEKIVCQDGTIKGEISSFSEYLESRAFGGVPSENDAIPELWR